jgi:hypothetical protein
MLARLGAVSIAVHQIIAEEFSRKEAKKDRKNIMLSGVWG